MYGRNIKYQGTSVSVVSEPSNTCSIAYYGEWLFKTAILLGKASLEHAAMGHWGPLPLVFNETNGDVVWQGEVMAQVKPGEGAACLLGLSWISRTPKLWTCMISFPKSTIHPTS